MSVIARGTRLMRIATWNVNSVRQRLDHLLAWLRETAPDVVCLQEIKCVDEQFPRAKPSRRSATMLPSTVKKTFNGVAMLSKFPFDGPPRLAGDDDDVQSRFLEGRVSLKQGVVRIASSLFTQWKSAEHRKISIQTQVDIPTY